MLDQPGRNPIRVKATLKDRMANGKVISLYESTPSAKRGKGDGLSTKMDRIDARRSPHPAKYAAGVEA